MIGRTAKRLDKEEVLRFCTNTFEWDDYFDLVWDLWSDDPGKLYLVDQMERSKNFPLAISHRTICPNKRQIWLEGESI